MTSVAYLTCSNCHASGEVRTNRHSYTCRDCHTQYEAIRCGKCHRAYLTDRPAWSSSKCPSCGVVEKMRTATVATFDEVKGLLTAEPSTPLSPTPPSKESPSLRKYLEERGGVSARVGRRIWPIAVSTAFVVLALLYSFRWGSVVKHVPSAWVWPGDLWVTYFATSQLAHGHVASIYPTTGFLEFPGIMLVLAPLGALSSVLHTSFIQILTSNGQVPTYAQDHVGPALIGHPLYQTSTGYFVAHPQWLLFVLPYVSILSCIALFAFDALAERLQISRTLRTVLCITETVFIWNITVIWGHPEDAIAVALAVYALIFTLDGRFVGAGWLFGAAVAFQPFVLVILPVIMAVGGRQRMLGMAIRSALPVAVLTTPLLIANFRATVHALLDEPYYLHLDHETPWTTLAPRLGGQGNSVAIAGGPLRILAFAIAIGLGFWVARHWRARPELVLVACVIALALRSYTESVLVAYYPSTALAVGVVVAASCSRWRFGVAIVLAVATTAAAAQQMSWFPWWATQMAGLTGLLVVIAHPKPLVATLAVEPGGIPKATVKKNGSGSTAKRSQPRRTQSPAATEVRSESSPAKKRTAPPAATKRSGKV